MPRLALVQMVSSSEPDRSLEQLSRLMQKTSSADPDAVFLPENFLSLGHPRPLEVAEQVSAEVLVALAEMAEQASVSLFAGTLPLLRRPDGTEVGDGRVRAASIVFDPTGQIIARYDKMHMFDVDVDDGQGRYRESSTFEPGQEPVAVQTDFGLVGLSVCYDLRFPEFYRVLFEQGVDVIAVPSAFTVTTGAAHFEVLMRARAIENSCYMVAACQGGDHDSGRQTWGHSMVVDPWGEVVGELEQGEGVLIVDIDFDRMREIRREMPFRQQRLIR